MLAAYIFLENVQISSVHETGVRESDLKLMQNAHNSISHSSNVPDKSIRRWGV